MTTIRNVQHTILYFTVVTVVTQASMVAYSSVKSMGMVSKDAKGEKVNVLMSSIGSLRSRDLSPQAKNTNSSVKRRCSQRIKMILGEQAEKTAEFRKELLLCQYQEVHAEMKKEQKEYERSLREGILKNVTNPYRKEYGDVTVNPHAFNFILQPEPCKHEETILVSVHSATENYKRRAVLRQTWGNPKIFKDFLPKGQKTKLVFILGLPRNISNQTLINYEQEEYNDIVQVDFIDHYYNNTYKAIYNMKWISSYSGCPNVNMIFKADDDLMINLRKFPSFWKKYMSHLGENYSPRSLYIGGHQFEGGPPRDPESKWYLPHDVYKYDTFPKWFQGMVYFLSPRLARYIYELSFTTPYIFTDDVYVGIVADRVEKLIRFDLGAFYSFAYDPLNKKMATWRFDPLVFYHNPDIVSTYKLWFFHCSYRSCL